jgi:hypothetical protein
VVTLFWSLVVVTLFWSLVVITLFWSLVVVTLFWSLVVVTLFWSLVKSLTANSVRVKVSSNRHTNFLMDFTFTNRKTLKSKTTKEASHMTTQQSTYDTLHKQSVYVWNIRTWEGHNKLALSVSCRKLIKRLRLYLWAPHITRAGTRSCKSRNILRTEEVNMRIARAYRYSTTPHLTKLTKRENSNPIFSINNMEQSSLEADSRRDCQ